MTSKSLKQIHDEKSTTYIEYDFAIESKMNKHEEGYNKSTTDCNKCNVNLQDEVYDKSTRLYTSQQLVSTSLIQIRMKKYMKRSSKCFEKQMVSQPRSFGFHRILKNVAIVLCHVSMVYS